SSRSPRRWSPRISVGCWASGATCGPTTRSWGRTRTDSSATSSSLWNPSGCTEEAAPLAERCARRARLRHGPIETKMLLQVWRCCDRLDTFRYNLRNPVAKRRIDPMFECDFVGTAPCEGVGGHE